MLRHHSYRTLYLYLSCFVVCIYRDSYKLGLARPCALVRDPENAPGLANQSDSHSLASSRISAAVIAGAAEAEVWRLNGALERVQPTTDSEPILARIPKAD